MGGFFPFFLWAGEGGGRGVRGEQCSLTCARAILAQIVKMSIKGWEAFFKVIRFQPLHAPITEAWVGCIARPRNVWPPETSQMDLARGDLPTAQLVLRKIFVEEGAGIVSEPTLNLHHASPPEAQAWILRQLRGTKKRIHLKMFNHRLGVDEDETEDARKQFISELSHHLRVGTFASLHVWSPFPMPQELTESLCVSRGLRALGLRTNEHFDLGYPSLARALLSPTATQRIESFHTEIGCPELGIVHPSDSYMVCRVWDFLDIPSLHHLCLNLNGGSCLFNQIEALKSHLRRRAELGLAPLQVIELVCNYSLYPSLEPVVAAIAEVSPTTVVKVRQWSEGF